MGITQAQNMNDSDTEMKNAPTKATADDKATTADDKATTENSSGDKPGSKIDNAAEIDNSGSHARIDDPVEPPARYAPKLRPEAGRPSIGETADLPPEVLEAGSKSILSRLFDPDRKQKPQLWTHIKLVAPGPADQPPPGHIKWRSKHAVAAYCLKCKKQFTYTRGTSKTISRHMQAYHGLVLSWNNGSPDKPKRAGEESLSAPPLKKRSINQPTQSSELLLLKWAVSSFQPWSVVESKGIQAFCSSLSNSFSLPTKEGLIRIATDSAEKVKLEIRRLLKDASKYSLICSEYQNAGKDYTSVKVTFCSSAFQLVSFTLGSVEGKCSDETVRALLKDYSLSTTETTNVTLMNVPSTVNLGIGGEERCVLQKLDSVLQASIAAKGPMSNLIKHSTSDLETVKAVYNEVQDFVSALSSEEGAASKKATDEEVVMLKFFTTALRPFFDAHNTLAGETYPTIGLAIPVIRRIRDVLEKMNIADLTSSSMDSQTVKTVTDFHKTLVSKFSETFAYILDENPAGMWTMPLDPRLIHIGALSDQEKEAVSKILIEKVKEKKMESSEPEAASDSVLPGGKAEKPSEASTMGGIFWGDDTVDNDASGGNAEAALSYARSNVDRYFTTVKSQRRVEDPLAWWKENNDDFPELASLAKVWLGAPVIGPEADGRTDHLEGNIDLMVFLHENVHHF